MPIPLLNISTMSFKLISSKIVDPSAQKLILRLLYNHDGLMTTLLSTITNSTIDVELLSQSQPKDLSNAQNPIQRVVYLKSKEKTLAIGRSFWNTEAYHKIIKNKNQGIGSNMIKSRVEYFRDINWKGTATVQVGGAQLSDLPSRSYRMFHQERVVCRIQEYFLPDILGYV